MPDRGNPDGEDQDYRRRLKEIEAAASEALGQVFVIGPALDLILNAAKDEGEESADPVALARKDAAAGVPGPIESRSAAFLIKEFTNLRDDLAAQVRQGGRTAPDPANAARELAIYEGLLAGLTFREAFPDDEGVREYVAEVMRENDREANYEEVALEHRAYAELLVRLAPEG